MAKSVLCLVLIAALAKQFSYGYNYQNSYDNRLDFRCSKENQAISAVRSIHSGIFEDRKFDLDCRNVDSNINGALGRRRCNSSPNWENTFDHILAFHCKYDRYIIGMTSEHSDFYEDRRWKFTCCGFDDLLLYDCQLTDWTHSFDGIQHYRVPSGMVITGVISHHMDFYEDRRYMYNICRVKRRSTLCNDRELSKTEQIAKTFCQGRCTKEHLCSIQNA